MIIGGGILILMALSAVAAPLIAPDPLRLNPINRLKPPSEAFWFGADFLGRDVYARTIYGGQISLMVGLAVAVISTVIGLSVGLVAGYIRWVDAVVMRVMDGLMAIPGVLLAIALISLAGASIVNVIIAISIPEIPRVVRLVRAVVLTVREQPYVEAAVSVGTKLPKILLKHILPNTLAPLIVQATYVCASAVVIEAILSFLGAGTPPEIPSWGNIMAEGADLLPVRALDDLLPRHLPRRHRAGGEHTGRRPARLPRPPHRPGGCSPMANGAILEIDGLKTHFHTRDGIVRAVDGVSIRVDRGEDAFHRRRVRLRQERDGHVGAAAAARAARENRGGAHPVRWRGPVAGDRGADAGYPGQTGFP